MVATSDLGWIRAEHRFCRWPRWNSAGRVILCFSFFVSWKRVFAFDPKQLPPLGQGKESPQPISASSCCFSLGAWPLSPFICFHLLKPISLPISQRTALSSSFHSSSPLLYCPEVAWAHVGGGGAFWTKTVVFPIFPSPPPIDLEGRNSTLSPRTPNWVLSLHLCCGWVSTETPHHWTPLLGLIIGLWAESTHPNDGRPWECSVADVIG